MSGVLCRQASNRLATCRRFSGARRDTSPRVPRWWNGGGASVTIDLHSDGSPMTARRPTVIESSCLRKRRYLLHRHPSRHVLMKNHYVQRLRVAARRIQDPAGTTFPALDGYRSAASPFPGTLKSRGRDRCGTCWLVSLRLAYPGPWTACWLARHPLRSAAGTLERLYSR